MNQANGKSGDAQHSALCVPLQSETTPPNGQISPRRSNDVKRKKLKVAISLANTNKYVSMWNKANEFQCGTAAGSRKI